jgi:peroxiredoxin Q/BCP
MAASLAATSLALFAETTLKEGDVAPRISGHDQDGNRWSSTSRLGKRMVLVYFYPDASTAGSTTEACMLCDNMVAFRQAGVDVVGVSFNKRKTQKEFAFKYNLNFPLLADTHGSIAEEFGVRLDEQKKLDRRVSFLIGVDGKILHISDAPDPNVQLKEIAAALSQVPGPLPN